MPSSVRSCRAPQSARVVANPWVWAQCTLGTSSGLSSVQIGVAVGVLEVCGVLMKRTRLLDQHPEQVEGRRAFGEEIKLPLYLTTHSRQLVECWALSLCVDLFV